MRTWGAIGGGALGQGEGIFALEGDALDARDLVRPGKDLGIGAHGADDDEGRRVVDQFPRGDGGPLFRYPVFAVGELELEIGDGSVGRGGRIAVQAVEHQVAVGGQAAELEDVGQGEDQIIHRPAEVRAHHRQRSAGQLRLHLREG